MGTIQASLLASMAHCHLVGMAIPDLLRRHQVGWQWATGFSVGLTAGQDCLKRLCPARLSCAWFSGFCCGDCRY